MAVTITTIGRRRRLLAGRPGDLLAARAVTSVASAKTCSLRSGDDGGDAGDDERRSRRRRRVVGLGRSSSRPSRRTWRAARTPTRMPPTANIRCTTCSVPWSDRWSSSLSSDRSGWQARRDSNPHPADLESAALPIRATGLRARSVLRLPFLLRLLVVRVLAAARAVLGELQLVRRWSACSCSWSSCARGSPCTRA